MRGIRDMTSKLAELGIKLRSEIKYPFFHLNSLSDQNHPLQLGIKCLALLPNNCNPAIVQEMSLTRTPMNNFFKK